MIKNIQKNFIIFFCFFFTSTAHAASLEELQGKLFDLLQQRISELQDAGFSIDSRYSVAEFTLPAGDLCGFRYRETDTDLVGIQQELKNQGYAITKVDGKYGPETKSAVMTFQSAADAKKIDGIVGEETRILLSKHSLVCEGDPGVAVVTNESDYRQVSDLSNTPILPIGDQIDSGPV